MPTTTTAAQAAMTTAALLLVSTTAAHAVVDSWEMTFTGEVDNIQNWDGDDFIDTGVNESFSATGGSEILPFSQSASGGTYGGLFDQNHTVRAAGSSFSTTQGELFTSINGSSSLGGDAFYDGIPSGPRVEITQVFTISAEMEYTLTVVRAFYDNDLGFGSVKLREVGGPSIVEHAFFDGAETFTGTLGPGEYELFASGGGRMNFDVDLEVIPAPGAAVLFISAGACAVRRRSR